jgi:membrane-bound lytic murein transglycosylase A
MGGTNQGETRLTPLAFSDLPGWNDDDHAAALAAFVRGDAVRSEYPPKSRALGLDATALGDMLGWAGVAAKLELDGAKAKQFFELRFTPVLVEEAAFFTGYYEPEVPGSLIPTAEFSVPLHRPPADLVEVEPGTVPGLDPAFRFARRAAAGWGEHHDRRAVMGDALSGQNLELVYVRDPIDAFFIHVQGAARIIIPDGHIMRVTYAAKSGHPYTPIGRIVADRAGIAPATVTMPVIHAWLAEHPDEAADVMAANRSYIYFREAPVSDPTLGPIGAAKVPLTAGRSLAVDRLLHTFHTPIWIETTLPAGGAFRHLMVAQDTGSAIIGPARGEIFFGSGDVAGAIAGSMRAAGRFIVLLPRAAR